MSPNDMSETMRELLARVQRCTGPDRNLDLAIDMALRPENYPDSWSWDEATRPPHLTASIDNALALVEKVLPGWSVNLQTQAEQYEVRTGPRVFTPLAEIYQRPLSVNPVYTSRAASPALAILAALLRAHLSEPKG